MSAHQREEAQNGGCSPESILNYLEIWIRRNNRRPSSIYMAFSRGLGVKNKKLKKTAFIYRQLSDDPSFRPGAMAKQLNIPY
jgi:hypothetical protein